MYMYAYIFVYIFMYMCLYVCINVHVLNNMINTMSIKTDFTFYISIYFLCSFKSIFLYGIVLILIVVYCLIICIRFEGKIYISYNLISYGPNGPLEFAHFLQQIMELPIITQMGLRTQVHLTGGTKALDFGPLDSPFWLLGIAAQ